MKERASQMKQSDPLPDVSSAFCHLPLQAPNCNVSKCSCFSYLKAKESEGPLQTLSHKRALFKSPCLHFLAEHLEQSAESPHPYFLTVKMETPALPYLSIAHRTDWRDMFCYM